MILGLTRGSTKAHLTRAALQAIAFQARDVLEAMTRDTGIRCASSAWTAALRAMSS